MIQWFCSKIIMRDVMLPSTVFPCFHPNMELLDEFYRRLSVVRRAKSFAPRTLRDCFRPKCSLQSRSSFSDTHCATIFKFVPFPDHANVYIVILNGEMNQWVVPVRNAMRLLKNGVIHCLILRLKQSVTIAKCAEQWRVTTAG